MPIAPGQHDGITGVTFSSDGHRLLGTLYLQLARRARQPFRYEEIDGAGHDFAGERAYLRDLVTGWLDEIAS